jgi:thymidylate synthase ThyX
MKVEILDYTKNAIELLIFCKGTRLGDATTIDDIIKWPYEKKMDNFSYMKDTIKSQFEFVDFTFLLSDVSRNFTHQLVRTRTNSYSQESFRAVSASEKSVYNLGINESYDDAVATAFACYDEQISQGIPMQIARGCLPTDTLTNIIVKTNLRTMYETALVRLCTRTAGEYQSIFKEMKRLIVEIYPEFDSLIEVACVQTGVCCFPRYTECPVQPYTVIIGQETKGGIKKIWEQTNHVADPSGAI